MGKILKECWKDDIWLKILTVVSVLLIVIDFFVQPMAVIDSSVLAAAGILTGIGALWELNEAVDNNLNAKIKIAEIELEISRNKGNVEDDDEK